MHNDFGRSAAGRQRAVAQTVIQQIAQYALEVGGIESYLNPVFRQEQFDIRRAAQHFAVFFHEVLQPSLERKLFRLGRLPAADFQHIFDYLVHAPGVALDDPRHGFVFG